MAAGDLYIMFYEACVKGSNAYLQEKDRVVGILLYWMSLWFSSKRQSACTSLYSTQQAASNKTSIIYS